MNTLWQKTDIRNVVAETLEKLNDERTKYSIIEQELLDGFEQRVSPEDEELYKIVIHIKDSLLRSYADFQQIYETELKIKE